MADVLHRAIHGARFDAFDTPSTGKSVDHIARGEWRSKGRDDIRSSGYSIHTLEAAVWSVGTSSSFEEAALKANLGGDADTVGAVAGQFAGALWGLEAIPAEWLRVLAWRDRLEAVGRDLIKIGHGQRLSTSPA